MSMLLSRLAKLACAAVVVSALLPGVSASAQSYSPKTGKTAGAKKQSRKSQPTDGLIRTNAIRPEADRRIGLPDSKKEIPSRTRKTPPTAKKKKTKTKKPY